MSLINSVKNNLLKPAADGSPSVFLLYKRLFYYVKPYLFRALVSTLITIPIGAVDAAIAFSLRPYTDSVLLSKNLGHVWYIPLVIVSFTLFQGVLNYLSIYLNGWLGLSIVNDIRRELFEKLQRMDIRYFDITTSGAVIFRFFHDPESVQINFLDNFKQFLTRFFSTVSLAAVLLATSWKLAIVAITVLVLTIYPTTHIRKIIKSMANQITGLTGDILSFYTETVGGIKVIQGYNMPARRLEQFTLFQKAMFNQGMRCYKAQGRLTPVMHFIASIGVAVVIWMGSHMVVSHELTTGGFVTFLASLILLYNPIKNLGGTLMNTQLSLLAAARITELLDLEPTIKDAPGAIALPPISDSIVFENVNFEYVWNEPVLQNINLCLKKGETIALVGNSGGGKTTIASLIPRFYDVTTGAIKIDGVDIKTVTLESLRQQIALVMQDNFLFSGTIRQNLLVGNPNATEEAIWRALDGAYLKEFVEAQPQQLEALIGERGVMLSGGQRQRLSIARALLKDAPIVILDEATSALDNQSEAIVQKAIEGLMAERTVIVIAHRLSTIRNVDRIVVLDRGKVVEEGSHDDLLARNGVYAMFYHVNLQKPPEGLTDGNGDVAEDLVPLNTPALESHV
jgi:ATP-binding cassette, subfamily B, bacterial MsbA